MAHKKNSSGTRKKDTLYRNPGKKFVFDEAVAMVFEDMLARSIPGYGRVIDMTGILAEKYFIPGTSCYDLGCSLGAGAAEMRRRMKDRTAKILALDNSPSMIAACRERAKFRRLPGGITFTCKDIRNTKIANASVVALNYVLQFLKAPDKTPMIRKIFRGLAKGGVLILSEKIIFSDEEENRRQERRYDLFKRANGYTDIEIARKKKALKGVLTPETSQAHIRRLRGAGFKHVTRIFRSGNFISFAAVK